MLSNSFQWLTRTLGNCDDRDDENGNEKPADFETSSSDSENDIVPKPGSMGSSVQFQETPSRKKLKVSLKKFKRLNIVYPLNPCLNMFEFYSEHD